MFPFLIGKVLTITKNLIKGYAIRIPDEFLFLIGKVLTILSRNCI